MTLRYAKDFPSKAFCANLFLSVALAGVAAFALFFPVKKLVAGTSAPRLCGLFSDAAQTGRCAFLPENVVVGILAFIGWAPLSRVIRGMILSYKQEEYIEAARVIILTTTEHIRRDGA
jgi:ABC-type dipeptide/oligopeptide/nickel transport system permease subunit